MHSIKIGTLLGPNTVHTIPQLIGYGFETFSITFWQTAKDIDLPALADKVKKLLDGTPCYISSLSMFGNPLMDTPEGMEAREGWAALIDAAALFGTDMVTGFTGALVNQSVDAAIPKFREVFEPLAKRAQDKGVRIAFENCSMGGNWDICTMNLAMLPKAWDLLFEALPYDNVGLQWEPCHQMVQLIDPIPQLRKWVAKGKIFNLHGKDATIAWDIIKEYGIYGGEEFAWHRTPGFGDSDWRNIITILRMGGYTGSIDIEGYHDPVYRGELEYTGQVTGLNYLKQCRGGEFIVNPE